MKVMIIGGHLSPALAVIDGMPKEWELVFVGRKNAVEGDNTHSLEYQEIIKRNIPFLPLSTARIQRTLTRHTLPSFAKLPKGFYQALLYLKKEKPDVVVAFGGYLSVPVGYAARVLGIPLVIHEQTLEAGLANKLLSRVAAKVCISWSTSEKFFPKNKIVLTGNPLKQFVRGEMPFAFSSRDKKLPLLYVTGGSTGSHAINAVVEQALRELLKLFRIIHQTGDSLQYNDYARLVAFRETLSDDEKERYIIEKFISPTLIGAVLTESDILISRSGINTVSELLFFGKPALLIPLPSGQQHEQLKNALFLKECGLAEVLPQDKATADSLITHLKQMLEQRTRYEKNAEAAKKLLHLNAAESIIKTTAYVVTKKSS